MPAMCQRKLECVQRPFRPANSNMSRPTSPSTKRSLPDLELPTVFGCAFHVGDVDLLLFIIGNAFSDLKCGEHEPLNRNGAKRIAKKQHDSRAGWSVGRLARRLYGILVTEPIRV